MFQRGRIVLLDGGSYLGRTMLTRLYSGEVRQVIETSKVEGQNSMTGFDAICRSRGAWSVASNRYRSMFG